MPVFRVERNKGCTAAHPIDKSIISGYTTPSQRDDGNQ